MAVFCEIAGSNVLAVKDGFAYNHLFTLQTKVIQRYKVDYVLMPDDRPILDPIYYGEETDPRIAQAANVLEITFVFFRVQPNAG